MIWSESVIFLRWILIRGILHFNGNVRRRSASVIIVHDVLEKLLQTQQQIIITSSLMKLRSSVYENENIELFEN